MLKSLYMIFDFAKLQFTIYPEILVAIAKINTTIEVDVPNIANIIQVDKKLSTKIIEIANSDFFSQDNEITNLEQAISTMGIKTFYAIAMTFLSKTIFYQTKHSKFHHYIWKHSVVVAILSKEIASALDYKDITEEAFVAGLLHDLGKVILNIFEHNDMITAIQNAIDNNIKIEDAIKDMFPISYIEAGVQVSEYWNFSPIYKKVIQFNEYLQQVDNSTNDTENTILTIVAIANYIANKHAYGHPIDANDETLEIALKKFNNHAKLDQFLRVNFMTSLINNEKYSVFTSLI